MTGVEVPTTSMPVAFPSMTLPSMVGAAPSSTMIAALVLPRMVLPLISGFAPDPETSMPYGLSVISLPSTMAVPEPEISMAEPSSPVARLGDAVPRMRLSRMIVSSPASPTTIDPSMSLSSTMPPEPGSSQRMAAPSSKVLPRMTGS